MRFFENVNEVQLSSILAFLVREENENGHSFICNRSLIEDAHLRGEICCVTDDDDENNAIGFLSYKINDYEIELGIMCIDFNRRREGIGRFLFETFERGLIERGDVLLMHAQCSPEDSELYWLDKGFVRYPPKSHYHSYRGIYLYKIVHQINYNQMREGENIIKIEIWHENYYDTEIIARNPDETLWLCDTDEQVIFPCHYDYPVRITYQDKPYQEKLKYTPLGEFRYDDFVIIKSCMELIDVIETY